VNGSWTWQMVGEDSWEFGEVVRGMIRAPKGFVYFYQGEDEPLGSWKWCIYGGKGGTAPNRRAAAGEVERALGIVTPGRLP
jgi:hypothetical protein